MARRALFLIALCCGVGPASAQSLRDLARDHGGKAEALQAFNLPLLGLSELFARSDLVVHGRIVEQTTRLAPDESYVITYDVLAPMHVIKQTRPTLLARPGDVAKIVVRRSGGTVIENGLQMSTSVNIYPESESFKLGEEVIMLLEFGQSTGVYRYAGGPFGAFRVQDGLVRPMTLSVAERRGDAALEVGAFLNQLRALK